MAGADAGVVVNGKVQGCESKERWCPGDPVPWTRHMCHGVPFNTGISVERCLKIPAYVTRPDDVFIVTYPKSGTTWMQQIVKCLQTRGYPEREDKTLGELYPWFEEMSQDKADRMPSPRILKCHSPYHMVAKGSTPDTKCKYIHIVRNPKDVCVSQYHHFKAFWEYEYKGEFAEFLDLFLNGQAECGSWFDFVRSWSECSENVLQMSYEDMKENPAQAIQSAADFIGLECSDEIIKLTVEKSSFAAMKKDKAANMTWMNNLRHDNAVPFMRKGMVGDWMNHFTEEQSQRFDEVLASKCGDLAGL